MKSGKISRFRSASKEINEKMTQMNYFCRQIFDNLKKCLFVIIWAKNKPNLVTLSAALLCSVVFTNIEKSAVGLPYPYVRKYKHAEKMGKLNKRPLKTKAKLVHTNGSDSDSEDDTPAMPTPLVPSAPPAILANFDQDDQDDQDEADLRERLQHGAAALPPIRVRNRNPHRQVLPTIIESRGQRLLEAIQNNPQWVAGPIQGPIQVPNMSSTNAEIETITISSTEDPDSDIFEQDTIAVEDFNVVEDFSEDDDVFEANPVEGAASTATINVEESAQIGHLRQQSQQVERLLMERQADANPTLQSPTYFDRRINLRPSRVWCNKTGQFQTPTSEDENEEDDGWGQFPVAREVLSSRLRPRPIETVTLSSTSTSGESVVIDNILPVLPETVTLTSTSTSEGSIIVDNVKPEPEIVRISTSSDESVKILPTPPAPPKPHPTKLVGTAHPIRRPDLDRPEPELPELETPEPENDWVSGNSDPSSANTSDITKASSNDLVENPNNQSWGSLGSWDSAVTQNGNEVGFSVPYIPNTSLGDFASASASDQSTISTINLSDLD